MASSTPALTPAAEQKRQDQLTAYFENRQA